MKNVIFLCVGNSCRSQMAEGLARRMGAGTFEATSAGTKPTGTVDEAAIDVMAEVGIDISHQRSKLIDLKAAEAADMIITMGCTAEEVLPTSMLSKVTDWDLEDPVGEDVEVFRRVRGEIERRMWAIAAQLDSDLD